MSHAIAFFDFLASGRGAGPRPRQARDARIDVVRGLALLIIFVNHMPGNVVAQWMPHHFGFSDAADIFVLLAGVSASLAFGTTMDRQGLALGSLKVAARIWTLYIAHIAVFILACGMLAAAVTRTQNPLYIEAVNIQPFFSDTQQALIDTLTLTYQPNYLDILPLYIVLLASFPLIHLTVRTSPALALAGSLTLWQAALHFGWNLPNSGASVWFFNPFAWQVVFVLGAVIGRAAVLGIGLPRWRWLDLLAAAFLLFSLIVKVSNGNPFGVVFLNDWVEHLQLGSDKTNLAWSRIAHLGALAWLAIRHLPAGPALASHGIGRRLAMAGRHSLEVFCAGILLSLAGQVVLAETSFALGVQLLVCLSGVILLTGLGVFLSWYKSLTQAAPAGAGSRALQAS